MSLHGDTAESRQSTLREMPITDSTAWLEAADALAPQVSALSETIETQRRLPLSLVQAMKDAGIFRMALSRAYGGSELDPLTQVRVVEALSRMDGSVGWCAMIGLAGGYLSAFLQPSVVQRFFADANTVAAGQVAPTGMANIVEGGYQVNGRWRFASGCQHADVLFAGCLVCDEGKPKKQANGQPKIRLMMVPRSACTIIDTWQTTGLRGTGSHDFTLNDVFVPSEESLSFFDPPVCSGPLYAMPTMFLVGHAGVPLGIVQHALDTVVALSAEKEMLPTRRLLREEAQVQEAVAESEAALGAARSYAYTTVDEIWQTLCREQVLSERQRSLFRLMLVYVHRVAKDVVSTLYDIAATSAVFQPHPLDRCLRDMVTACQHRVIQAKMYRPAGRLLLGLDPGDPFF